MRADPRLIEFARQMRREPPPTERIMWRLLRGHRLAGFRFRRQQPVPPYIADYYCAVAKLVIEVDGDSHAVNEEADRVRNEWFEERRLKVLHFWNSEVFDDPDAVLETIYRTCIERGASDPRFAGRIDASGRFNPPT